MYWDQMRKSSFGMQEKQQLGIATRLDEKEWN